jgi:hypothetical protein
VTEFNEIFEILQFVDIKTGLTEPNQILDISGKSTKIFPDGILGLNREANEKYLVFLGCFGILAIDLQVEQRNLVLQNVFDKTKIYHIENLF